MQIELPDISIIFSTQECGIAQNIETFLREKLLGEDIPQPTAVILISDSAVEDGQWQSEVRALPDKMRLIPAGQTINADYSNPDIIPTRVEELNFIRIDENLCSNIWESATIDADFYEMRNNVLVSMDAWLASQKSDSFLLSNYKQTRRGLRLVEQKLSNETDEHARVQLQQMELYLSASRKQALRNLLKTTRHRIFVGFLAALLIGLVFTTKELMGYFQRASDEMALLGAERTEANAFDNTVRILDGIGNPLIEPSTRNALFQELNGYLDMNWASTPIGLNYKHGLTSAQLLDDRFVQTSTDHGHQLVWDTYSGEVEIDNALVEQGVLSLFVDTNNNISVMVTGDSRIYFNIDKKWYSNNSVYSFPDGQISVKSNANQVVVCDSKSAYFFTLTSNGIQPTSYITEETMPHEDYMIHGVVLSDDNHAVAFTDNGDMKLIVYEGEAAHEWSAGVKVHPSCKAAVLQDQVVFADNNGNILQLDAEATTVNSIGLRLPNPQVLCFVNETTIAYHDGILGSRLYDFRQEMDLGEIFSDYEGIDSLQSNGSTVMCHTNGLYVCQSIATMLPLSHIDESGVVKVYDETPSESRFATTAYGGIANGDGVVVGRANGEFQELVMREDGSPIYLTSKRAPSHSAIVAIYEMPDCYYLLDAAGNYWYARLRYPSTKENPNLILYQINERLHHGVTKELYDSVSKDTREDMSLTIMPGGDGREWE